jgi:hypothetical protein
MGVSSGRVSQILGGGEDLTLRALAALSGSTWVSSGIHMVDVAPGIASAELPGAGLYTAVAVTNAGSDR